MSKEMFDEVAAKIRAANEGVNIQRVKRKDMNVLGSVRVSKGDVTFPFFTLMTVDEATIVLHHNKGCFPLSKDLHMEFNFGTGRGYYWQKVIDKEHWKIMVDATKSWEVNKSSSLTGFTWIIAYCEAKGVNLFDIGIFEA